MGTIGSMMQKHGRRSITRPVDGLLPTGGGDVAARIGQLAGAMGLGPGDVALATRRFSYMRADELRGLADKGCSVELHGHVHHYPLGDADAFRADLAACRDVIVALGLPEPRHYCYPSGSFDSGAPAVLKAQGINTATTCVPGLVTRKDRSSWRYFLPRFLDGDNIDMLVFEAEMSGFAHCMRWLFRR